MGRAQGKHAGVVSLSQVVARRRETRPSVRNFRPQAAIDALNTNSAQRFRLAQLTAELASHEAEAALARQRGEVEGLLRALDAPEDQLEGALEVIRDQAQFDLHTHISVANNEGRRLTSELVADGATFSLRIAAASVASEVAQQNPHGALAALGLPVDEADSITADNWFDSLRAAIASPAPREAARDRLSQAVLSDRVHQAIAA